MNIVPEGPRRLGDATREERIKREAEIRAELTALFESQLRHAGFFRRGWIKFRMQAELRKRMDREFPRTGRLHLRGTP